MIFSHFPYSMHFTQNKILVQLYVVLKHTHHCNTCLSCQARYDFPTLIPTCINLKHNSSNIRALLKSTVTAVGGTKSHNTGSTREIWYLGTNHIFNLATHWCNITSVRGYKWKISHKPIAGLDCQTSASCTLSNSKAFTIRSFHTCPKHWTPCSNNFWTWAFSNFHLCQGTWY